MNFTNLLKDLKSNKINLKSYIHEVCKRIKSVDPTINALLPEQDRYSRLEKEAEELERRFPDPKNRPPLYGVLVGIKDNLRVNGFPTKAGSMLPSNIFEGPEAESVTRLRKAGALILGKTVTTEFAYFEPGPTSNPHNIKHTPGGSSSGSAAAVAAGLSPLTLGTQTIASVNRPASYCGVVGFKPSLDRIPTSGLIYYSRTMDQIGFFTKNMDGVEIAASALCDNWNLPESGQLTTPILGVPEGPYLSQTPSKSLAMFERNLEKLLDAGYLIKRVPILKDIHEINQLHQSLVVSELAIEHDDWFRQYDFLYRPKTKAIIEEGKRISNQVKEKAKNSVVTLRNRLQESMIQNNINVWVCPSSLGPAPKGLHSTGDPIMSVPWTHAGMPSITIPALKDSSELPVGLQFVSSFMNDEWLIEWSKGLEKVFNV